MHLGPVAEGREDPSIHKMVVKSFCEILIEKQQDV